MRASDSVTDLDVVESYRESCAPGGLMADFIMSAEVAIRMGPVLFVHAGVPRPPEVENEKNFSFRSYPPAFSTPARSFDDWMSKVREFVDEQRSHWRDGVGSEKGVWASRGGYQLEPDAGGSLMQYGMGYMLDGEKILKNPTVVYASWLKEGQPFCPEPATEEMFDEAGLKLIVTGHQPHGDAPLPIRVGGGGGGGEEGGGGGSEGSKLIITGDTSYSGDVQWQEGLNEWRKSRGRDGSLSGRGQVAVSEILLEIGGADNNELLSVKTRGTLSDGSDYETELMGEDAKVVGTEVDVDGTKWWIKARLDDGKFLGTRSEGWNITNTVLQLN